MEEKARFLMRLMKRQRTWQNPSYRARRAHVAPFVRPRAGAEARRMSYERSSRWRRPQRCSVCGGTGHNKATCTAKVRNMPRRLAENPWDGGAPGAPAPRDPDSGGGAERAAGPAYVARMRVPYDAEVAKHIQALLSENFAEIAREVREGTW